MTLYAHQYRYHRPPLLLVREGETEWTRPEPVAAESDAFEDPVDESVALEEQVDESDALEDLADEITTLAAHIHAATQRLLALIAEFDGRGGWKAGGHRSCAHWLAFRTGIDLGTAREKVRTARVLAGLPETSASMARGELSFSAVRALTRVATPETEADLLELARGCTTAQLERVVRGWRTGARATEAERERDRHRRRTFSVFAGDDGMYVVRGRLPAEVGALLMSAIDAASDALWREEGSTATDSTADTTAEAARRRADALALVAERALAAGFGGRATTDGDEPEERRGGEKAPISGTRAERYQIMIHVSPETLSAPCGARERGDGDADVSAGTCSARMASGSAPHVPDVSAEAFRDPLGDADAAAGSPDVSAGTCSAAPTADRSHLHDGTRLPAETSRRLACDAARVTVARGRDGAVLDVGRRTRTVPPSLRRALEVRDRGCRFPGCGARFTDAHHVRHWADGGETSLANCLLLCRHHHRLMHEGGWSLEWWGEGRPAFRDPRGRIQFEGRWSPPDLGDAPVDALVATNKARGADPDWRTAGARWKREEDIPTEIYLRGLEATR